MFISAPYGEVGLDGNSIAILSKDGVLVFDSNGTPAAAAAVLAEIRTLTDRPVRYLVHSHWHWDHWYGAQVYTDAFPDVTIVAHEKTREMMMGPALEFNRPGLENGLPGYITSLEAKLAAAKSSGAAAADVTRLIQRIETARFFLDQKTSVRHTFPTKTFTDRMDITLGERQVQVLNYGRAVTPGDTFLYLPAERVLITGDLLVNPISFALSCYPSEWLQVLEKLDALDATVIVPGHGEPLRDKTLLRATRDVFRILLTKGREAKAKGLDADQAKEAIMPALADLTTTIAGDDQSRRSAFRTQLVDWYLHRVYDELNGPLTDKIAAIPEK
jgi:glyoxylase-like metal-dependent hydrolase (beta-lactamase superfamily II)